MERLEGLNEGLYDLYQRIICIYKILIIYWEHTASQFPRTRGNLRSVYIYYLIRYYNFWEKLQ